MRQPHYCLRILISGMGALEAAEELAAIRAAAAPHLRPDQQRTLTYRLQRQIALSQPRPERQTPTFIADDPEKAAEYAQSLGFRVVRKKVESA